MSHGALAGPLAENGVDVLICGGLGGGALAALQRAGVCVYGGTQGPTDEASCGHHGHHEGGCGHGVCEH